MANGRARVNHIGVIEDDGRKLDREKDKSDYFYSKFKERFEPGSTLHTSRGDWSNLFCDRAFLRDDNLTTPLSIEEVKKATFHMNGDKAPGPDGFSMAFCQKFWEVIKTDLLKIFEDLYDDTLNTCDAPLPRGVTHPRTTLALDA